MPEKEYIEREALQNKAFGENHPTFYDGQDIADWYEKCINEMPAADVSPVVRCKDCKWRPLCCRTIRTGGNKPDDFCSFGERKDG